MIRLVATMIALSLSAAALGQAKVSYDRFKDRTEVSASKPGVNLEGFNLLWSATFPGQDLVSRAPARLIIMTSSKEWQYLRCHDVNILVDGKPAAVGANKHQGEVQRGYVVESVFVEVPEATMDKLARAASIEMRLCRTEYRFDEADAANVREFVAATTPSKR